MSQSETLALVATAVDNASGPLKQVRRALDDLAKADLGPHQKQLEKFRKELSGLSGSTEGFRRSGTQVSEFGKRFQELSARAAATSVGITRTFIPALASLGISTVTVASALTGLTIATQRYADASREASKLARETGFSPRFVQGIKGAAEELHVHGEQIGSILEDLSGKFQRFSLPGGGELGKNMALSRDFRSTFGEMRRIMADQNKPLDERNAQSLGVLIDRINELKRAGTPDVRLREMIKDLGLDPSLVDLASKNWATIKDRMEAYIKKVGELDPAKAKAYAEANRELARSFEGLSNAVGGELIGKLTDITNAISQFIDANKADINSGILREIKGIETAATSVITLFNQIKAATSFLQAPQPKEGEGRWDFFKRRWGLDGGDQKRRSQLPAEPSTVPPEVLDQMNVLPEVKVTPPANPKYRAPFSPRSGQQLPKADAVRFADGDFSGSGAKFTPDPDFLSGSPMSSNIEDRRNGYVGEGGTEKALAANTSQLEVLNRLLDEWLRDGSSVAPGGGAAGGSGGAYRFTGGGGVAAPRAPGGTGGLPGLPLGGTGVPGGDGLFDRLQSPLGRRRREDGAFGTDGTEGPAPTGQRPHDRFLPSNAPFGPSNTPNQFRPVGPGSRVEPPAGMREANQAASNVGQPGRGGDAMAPKGTPTSAAGQTEVVTSPSGAKFRVASEFAPNFRGFLKDFEEQGGKTDPGTSGGLSGRPNNASYHPLGRAIDVNQLSRDRIKSGLPGGIPAEEALAKKWGLRAGSQFSDPDRGHYEVAKRDNARQALLDQGITPPTRTASPDVTGDRPSWPRTMPQVAGPMPGALGSNVENLPTRPAVPDLPAGALNPNASKMPGAGGGAAFLQQQRAGIMAELRNDPETLKLAKSVSHLESTHAFEAMVNRTAMIREKVPGYGIKDELNSGFYSTRSQAGRTNLTAEQDALQQSRIDAVGAGSNALQGRTDQGSGSDPNVNGPGRVKVPGDREVYNFWQGKRRGQEFSHADSQRFAEEQQRQFNQQQTQIATLTARPSTPTLPDGVMSPGKLAGSFPPKDDDDNEAEAGGFSRPGQFSKAGGYSPIPGELSARSQKASEMTHRVEGSGHITVDVNAPRGVKTKASSDGMFKRTTLNRTVAGQESPARTGTDEE